MIKKAVIVNMPTNKKQPQYLNVEFTDGTFVNLNEEELKRASSIRDELLLQTLKEIKDE
tara:strand:- start:286 stop:462 length:177 start_codon:yes stop_codon:yes gene_type:complete